MLAAIERGGAYIIGDDADSTEKLPRQANVHPRKFAGSNSSRSATYPTM
jgi:hypothetical protein